MRIIPCLCAIVIALSLTGCDSGDIENGNFSQTDSDYLPNDYSNSEDVKSSITTDRKLVKKVSISAETLEYDIFIEWLEKSVADAGGYIESSNVSQSTHSYVEDYDYSARYASYTLRIPADDLDAFLVQVGENCNVINQSSNIDDETFQYIDLKSHYDALQREYERLESLLDQTESFDDIITIESKLTDLRQQLQSYDLSIQALERQVEYSTVEMSIDEVRELSSTEGFFQDLTLSFKHGGQAFILNIQNLVLWFAENVLNLIVLAFVAFVIVFLYKRLNNRTLKKHKVPKDEENPPKED